MPTFPARLLPTAPGGSLDWAEATPERRVATIGATSHCHPAQDDCQVCMQEKP